MSEASDLSPMTPSSAVDAAGKPSPGTLLRTLRERQGMHMGVLATILKVSPRKLELLEADRFEELPDATFVKALALAVCRALRADPTEVMAAFAARDLAADPFKEIGKGLNAPMRSGGRGVARAENGSLPSFSVRTRWLVGLLAAVLLAVLAWWAWAERTGAHAARSAPKTEPMPSASARSLPATGPSASPPGDASRAAAADPAAAVSVAGVVSTSSPGSSPSSVAAAPMTASAGPPASLPPAATAMDPGRGTGGGASTAPEATLKVSVSADSWLEVVDASRRVVWSQVVPEGDSIQLTAPPPLQLVVGNARATRLEFAGQPVDLTAHVRGNVARLQVP